MPLDPFRGETFVAFIDICGFKKLMSRKNEAAKALDVFYRAGYHAISEHKRDGIEGLFVSDCGILFCRERYANAESLEYLLRAIEKINRSMAREELLTVCSIAFGEFNYQERLEFRGIEKNAVIGNAYLDAYLDLERGAPKIQPGQCRVLKNNLPRGAESIKRLRPMPRGRSHLYFYWMATRENQIDQLEQDLDNTADEQFRAIKRIIRTAIGE